MNKEILKTMVRGAYDVQKIRIQMGNRIVGNFKVKLGQEPGEDEGTMDAKGKQILNDLRLDYKKITDGVKTFPRQASFRNPDGVISTYTELVLVAQYFDLESSELEHFKRLGRVLVEFPIYTGFLHGVKGIGPAMAGVIISEINIHRAEYPSSVWKYAGLDVTKGGQGRSRKKEHLEESEYTNKEGEKAVKMGITFNPFLKTKLVGVMGPSFLRAGDNTYSRAYYDYKHRIENMPAHKEKTKLHRHNMAIRYMIKRFLVDLYTQWRTMEGLPVADEYSHAKLGIVHKAA